MRGVVKFEPELFPGLTPMDVEGELNRLFGKGNIVINTRKDPYSLRHQVSIVINYPDPNAQSPPPLIIQFGKWIFPIKWDFEYRDVLVDKPAPIPEAFLKVALTTRSKLLLV